MKSKAVIISGLVITLLSCNNVREARNNSNSDTNMVKTENLTPGPKVIIESEFCYYIPDSIEKSKYPLVFLFDPHAKGNVSIKKYIAQANKYGFVIAASLVSENGMPIENIKVHAHKVMDNIFVKLPVDKSGIIFAGFSGGGRVAIEMAREFKDVKGVITCGAADPLAVKKKVRNVVICGNEDFNYLECVSVALNQAKPDNFMFYSFDGKHEWPSEEIMAQAINFCISDDENKEVFSLEEEERIYLSTEEKIRNQLVQFYTTKGFDWWVNKIDDLRRNTKSMHKQEEKISKRLLAFIGMMSYAYTKNAIGTQNLPLARHCIKIYEYIEPDNMDMIAYKKQIEKMGGV